MHTSSDIKLLPSNRREQLVAAIAGATERHGGRYRHMWAREVWAAAELLS